MADNALECRLESRPDVLDEDEILVAAACEDAQAAAKLYDKYYDAILGYIYHATLDPTTTEDLTSNVFLAAFRHLGRYRWKPIHFRAWLYRIATNEIRMHYRKARRIGAFRLEAGSRGPDAAPPTSDRSAAAEEYRLLHQALLQLKLKYRTTIILRYFENRTIAEISEVTGRKQGTVRCQLHRGLAQLRSILTRQGLLP
ncbi:MAG: sigma-70 family RNA polymerase sigma factor [Sedimentisphaerales bacterium]|nr:sigma-70 family RNA polymerase sigma factor [Sedimentisphaerales bacterium]